MSYFSIALCAERIWRKKNTFVSLYSTLSNEKSRVLCYHEKFLLLTPNCVKYSRDPQWNWITSDNFAIIFYSIWKRLLQCSRQIFLINTFDAKINSLRLIHYDTANISFIMIQTCELIEILQTFNFILNDKINLSLYNSLISIITRLSA